VDPRSIEILRYLLSDPDAVEPDADTPEQGSGAEPGEPGINPVQGNGDDNSD
jgi:hypothetical protein